MGNLPTTIHLKISPQLGDWRFWRFKRLHSTDCPLPSRFYRLEPDSLTFPANPNSASPYSPSSRRWLNIAYIDINQLAEFQQSDEAQTWFHSAEIQQQLSELRTQDWLNYEQIIPLKLKGLRFAFAKFQQNMTACAALLLSNLYKRW